MTTKQKKKTFRKRHLFARSVEDVVKAATKPLMHQQGKLYGALLRDWEKIVGRERARLTRPDRLQFPHTEADGATLHLLARPAAAPELMYETEQMLEQCARYFGYRAITRIIIHASHALSTEDAAPAKPSTASPAPAVRSVPISATIPSDMRAILERIAQHVSTSDKR